MIEKLNKNEIGVRKVVGDKINEMIGALNGLQSCIEKQVDNTDKIIQWIELQEGAKLNYKLAGGNNSGSPQEKPTPKNPEGETEGLD